MSVIVDGITKLYGTQKAVNQISFSLNKGEVVGFLGPNGAGKSTTLKMITGYLQPTEGNITVSGINVHKNLLAAKKKIGYLPELNPLYTDMYVKEYLLFIAGVHQIKNSSSALSRVIQLTGLQQEQHKKIAQLSKGYKQRVGLAAALIHDPEILILDEPTSGLDPNQIIEIRNVIKEQSINKTVLFSSHILQEVEAICSRVIIINQGNIVANNTLSNLQEQSSSSNQMVSIRFDKAVDYQWFNQFSLISNIVSTNNNTAFQLQTPQPDELRKQLLQASVQSNFNIVSLNTETNNLEKIFKSLTLSQ